MAWLRLIRWKNLLIIFLTQYLAWLCVICPELPRRAAGYFLDPLHFFCLSIATVCIAAAGYIINDYFDIKIDLINRPGKVVLGNSIARKRAIFGHAILNGIALVLSSYVALRAHHPEWLALQALCVVLLWLYSTRFKRQYMTGNIVVAMLTALTIMVLVLYEPALHSVNSLPMWVLAVYAYFAFMLTWMREIVKDMEDYKGDESEGCETLPIKKGLQYAERVTAVLGVGALLPLLAAPVVLYSYHFVLLAIYVSVMVALPLLVWTVMLVRRRSVSNYTTASRWLKLIMVSGVSSLIIYYLELLTNRVA